jgi:hypothetical protein
VDWWNSTLLIPTYDLYVVLSVDSPTHPVVSSDRISVTFPTILRFNGGLVLPVEVNLTLTNYILNNLCKPGSVVSSMLHDPDPVAAIRWMVREVSWRTALTIGMSGDEPTEDLPEGLSLCLFRLTQEAVRHAQARTVHVELRPLRDCYRPLSPAARLPARNGHHGFRRDSRRARNSACSMSKSRPTRSCQDKEITKLEWKLRDIDLAIADFERLEAKSSSKGKGVKTPKSKNLIQMPRRPQGILHAGNASVARCSICGKELKFFEGGTPICGMCEQATPEEREVRNPEATGRGTTESDRRRLLRSTNEPAEQRSENPPEFGRESESSPRNPG